MYYMHIHTKYKVVKIKIFNVVTTSLQSCIMIGGIGNEMTIIPLLKFHHFDHIEFKFILDVICFLIIR